MTIVANECRSMHRGAMVVGPTPPARTEGAFNEKRLTDTTDLRRSIERLSHDDRGLLYLYYWLDLPLDEVAQALGVSVAAAKGRLYRAVGRLHERLTLPEELITT
jgi:DNA-directed RNA polymerase specialized sigma24 family protein